MDKGGLTLWINADSSYGYTRVNIMDGRELTLWIKEG